MTFDEHIQTIADIWTIAELNIRWIKLFFVAFFVLFAELEYLIAELKDAELGYFLLKWDIFAELKFLCWIRIICSWINGYFFAEVALPEK